MEKCEDEKVLLKSVIEHINSRCTNFTEEPIYRNLKRIFLDDNYKDLLDLIDENV